jgi:hypothetical protein
MKFLKPLLAGLLVVGFAGAASAQTELYIAGSTAYRASVVKSIQDVLITSTTTVEVAWDDGGSTSNNTAYKGSAVLISGSYNGIATFVHCYWTGSLSGVYDLAAANPISHWIPDSVITTSGTLATAIANSGTTGYDITGAYTPQTPSVPTEVAMSDSFSDSIAKTLGVLSKTYQNTVNNAPLANAGIQNTSIPGVVGIVPFVWVSGSQAGTPPDTNMTQQAAAALEDDGFVPVTALETGATIASDTNDYAFLVGRNEDSGTRIGAEAEAQDGSYNKAYNFGQPTLQYYATYTGGTPAIDGTFTTNANNGAESGQPIYAGGTGISVSDIGLWPQAAPLNTESGITWNTEGHSGQIAGGDVIGMLEALNPLYLNLTAIDTGDGQPSNWDPAGNGNATDHSNKAYLVGYLGISDASKFTSTHYMTYNGVPFSAANIYAGAYTFWTYEHMYYVTSGANAISGQPLALAHAIADEIYNYDAQTNSSGVTNSSGTSPASNDAGLFFPGSLGYPGTTVGFSRTREGYPLSPNF